VKVYTKSNHLILAIPITPDHYLEACDLRAALNTKGRFVPEVTEIDRVMNGWEEEEEEKKE
jgi:hypothetical protein